MINNKQTSVLAFPKEPFIKMLSEKGPRDVVRIEVWKTLHILSLIQLVQSLLALQERIL